MKQEAIVEGAYGWCAKIIEEPDLNAKLHKWVHSVDGVILHATPQLLNQVRGIPPTKCEVLNAIDTLVRQQR